MLGNDFLDIQLAGHAVTRIIHQTLRRWSTRQLSKLAPRRRS